MRTSPHNSPPNYGIERRHHLSRPARAWRGGALGPALRVRRATPDDATRLHGLVRASARAGWSGVYSHEQVTAWCRLSTPEYYQACIEIRDVLVAEIDGEIAGFAQLDMGQRRVLSLYVAPAHVRRGIGSALLRSIERIAVRRGVLELVLSSSLGAVMFYERVGYRAGERVELQLPGGLPMIVVSMRKHLAAHRAQ